MVIMSHLGRRGKNGGPGRRAAVPVRVGCGGRVRRGGRPGGRTAPPASPRSFTVAMNCRNSRTPSSDIKQQGQRDERYPDQDPGPPRHAEKSSRAASRTGPGLRRSSPARRPRGPRAPGSGPRRHAGPRTSAASPCCRSGFRPAGRRPGSGCRPFGVVVVGEPGCPGGSVAPTPGCRRRSG